MKRFIWLLVSAALAAGSWYLLAPSREAAVRKAFERAASALEKSGVEKPFDALAKARVLASLADPQCVFEFRGRTFQLSRGGADVTDRIATMRNAAAYIHVEFGEVSVSFPASDVAEANCGLSYVGEDFGLSVRDARSAEAMLRKDPDSGKWRFTHVRLK